MRAHYDELAELFDLFNPEDVFRRNDLPKFLRHAFDGMKNNEIVQQVQRDPDAPRGTIRYIWTIDERAYRWISSYEPSSLEMPCGHHGIVNLGGGKYQCCSSWCDDIHYRGEIEV